LSLNQTPPKVAFGSGAGQGRSGISHVVLVFGSGTAGNETIPPGNIASIFWVNLSQNLAGQGETSNPRGRTGRRAEVAAGMQGEKERALVAAGSQAHREKRGRW
jgi:hypothetical protein